MNLARLPRSFLGLTVGVLIAVRTASAAWPHDPDNGNTLLCAASGDQQTTACVSDGAGGAIVVWADSRSGNSDIFAQRVSSSGVPMWAGGGVALCTATGGQLSPVIASDGAGGAIVAWYDGRSGGNDIYAQRVSSAGAALWTTNGVPLCTVAGDQFLPAILGDGAGGATVAWHDLRAGASDIYAQRVNASGVAQWTGNGVAVCIASGSQAFATIASDGAAGAIIAWSDLRGATMDIYAQRMGPSGTPLWATNGVVVCAAAGSQNYPKIVSDAVGGAILTWEDGRGPSATDIYAQRVGPTGVPLWTTDGVALCTEVGGQFGPVLVTDGAGGAIVTWWDGRVATNPHIYAQRVNATGLPFWDGNGLAVCIAPFYQQYPAIVSDGAGGAVITWQDYRWSLTTADIYAQRLNAVGVSQWSDNGVALCRAPGDQLYPCITTDGGGGAIVAWQDARLASGLDVYAQRIERFGYLGSPEALIASVKDVPNDQGGQVKVSWYASWLDVDANPDLAAYDLYRSAPGSASTRHVRMDAACEARQDRAAQPAATLLYAWEYVGTVPAVHFLSAYGLIAPTTGDSMAGSNPRTAFLVVGRNPSGTLYWLSAPDSGYSVDNIAPATPTQFAGEYAGGTTHLHWSVNGEADFSVYHLYRGTPLDFVPAPGNRVASLTDPWYDDAAGAPYVYKLTAVDLHGNESSAATLLPGGALGVADGPVDGVSLAPPKPNPSRGRVALEWTQARAGRISLRVFDLTGRRVRELDAGERAAGRYTRLFDLEDDEGRALPDGLYWIRLEAGDLSLATRLVILR